MNTSLLQTLEQVDTCPFHMPGHKRNAALAPYLEKLGAALDITEITDCDCLHHADGILAQSMEKGRTLWRAQHTFLLINGSTGGLLSTIHAATAPGDGILMSRGCHKAVYNAVTLCRLRPHYLTQPQTVEGYPLAVTAQSVAQALAEHSDIRLVVITSPTYEGFLSPVADIAQICHDHGALLLVDEAHGAHLGFHPAFSGGAVAAGADMVVQSLHKTLPSLTQTAVAHVTDALAPAVQRSLSLFETSSPSYLLLASIDGCFDLLGAQGDTLFAQWAARLESFAQLTASLHHLRLVQDPAKDPSKLVISTAHANLDGETLKQRLHDEYAIELEMAYGEYALAMTGMGDTGEMLDALGAALVAIDATLQAATPTDFALPALPRKVREPYQMHGCAVVPCDPQAAVGKVAAGAIWVYPPGVPLIVPGEVYTQELVSLLERLSATGAQIQDTLHLFPAALGTVV